MISHRYRCIYIKVPRCGSTTLRDWFLDHGSGRHSFKPGWYGGILPDRMQSVTRVMFTHENWFRRQTVTVSAVSSAWGTATLTHTYDGTVYARTRPPPVVTVSVASSDRPDEASVKDDEAARLCAALGAGEEVTRASLAAALWKEGALSDTQLAALDSLGNGDGEYDLGDLLSWIERCQRGEECCAGSGPAPVP
ncbi:hypothetical protein [Candidatus Palauibacter sp.]|uniref:hypothetical protein n=1 Tax=Candidatus Palauibacter sp. TaxID=3101350 RepID=UPI003AF31559